MAEQCFYCKGVELVGYCMQFPCGDCAMVCDACIEDALTICDCLECIDAPEPIIQYEFREDLQAWVLGARQYSSDFQDDFQDVSADEC